MASRVQRLESRVNARLWTRDSRRARCGPRGNGSVSDQLLQRLRQNLDVFDPCSMPHQTHPPDFSFERSEAGADFDIELIIQALAYFGIVDAFRNLDRVDHRRAD